jgi:hypothetical protein
MKNTIKKICSVCKEEKPAEEYHRRSNSVDGLVNRCKSCVSSYCSDRYTNNKDKINAQSRVWRGNNIDRVKANGKKWRANNPEKEMVTNKRWRDAHPEKIAEWRTKALSNPKNRCSSAMSRSIRQHITQGSKSGRRWESLVGYTINQLKKHLEKKFKPGMTWENYGTRWHIDHKIPISVFNFKTPDDLDFRICWSLKNLQPLGAHENKVKHDKIDKPFQPSLAIGVM